MASGAFSVLDPALMNLVSVTKSNIAPIIGTTSLAVGIADASSAGLSGILAPLNIAAGGVVIILFFFGKGLLRIAEKWLDSQGEKLIALPTAAELKADKDSLFEMLDRFGRAADAERKEMSTFREGLAGTLANYGARIQSLENRSS